MAETLHRNLVEERIRTEAVEARQTASRILEFRVHAAHSDEGWDHYVDRWEIVAPVGSVLGTRALRHPHVEVQPFTRNLSDVTIPDSVESVTIRAHDSVHAFGGREATERIPR